MLSGGNEKSLQIKQNDKFFSRLLSKESSSNSISAKAESSFRVLYYGGACGAVPFMWESQPGTPKHPSSNYSSLPPPLTPPPSSFQFSPKSNSKSSKSKSKSIQKPSKPIGGKPNFLLSIFPRTASKKNHFPSPSLSSSSMSSSSCSSRSFSSPSTTGMNPYMHQKRCFWRSRSTVCFGVGDDDGEEEAGGSPASTFCFGTFSSSKDLCASRSRMKFMKFPL